MTETGPAVDFSSNDYLGLASDPRLARAAEAILGTQGVGATASRLIAGNHPEHDALEHELAQFFRAEAALTFATGYSANTGTIPAVVGAEDLILSDALNHASLIDGCRLSKASIRVFAHRDADALRRILEEERSRHRRALIVTDGVFSMDGDAAPISELVGLARAYDAWTYVDDAHAVGAVGEEGRGTAERHGVHGDVDITVGTFGKAFGVAGAFVYGSRMLITHLMNRARSFVFSTAMLPAQAAAARQALRIIASEPAHRVRLRSNAALLRSLLAGYGIAPCGEPTSHIIPVVIGGTDATTVAGAALRAQGLLVAAVRPPTVAEGSSRLRISVSAAHTPEQLRQLATAVGHVL